MARPHRALAAFAGCALVFAATAANAQVLRPLHVDALSMHADRAQVRVGDTFHLAIHAHVRERVAALDELIAPDVGTMHLLGDERRFTQSTNGTDMLETLTLEPSVVGPFTFAGAYLDAIDARTNKPSRFSATPVRVDVVGSPRLIDATSRRALRRLLAIVLICIVAIAAIIVLVALVRLRRRRPVQPKAGGPPIVAPPPPRRTPREEVLEALRAYRLTPANGALTKLRVSLFVAAGAQPGATLRDALAVTSDNALRGALIAAERTTFGPEHNRDAASEELVDATEAWLR